METGRLENKLLKLILVTLCLKQSKANEHRKSERENRERIKWNLERKERLLLAGLRIQFKGGSEYTSNIMCPATHSEEKF